MSQLIEEDCSILLQDCLNAFNKPLQLLKTTLAKQRKEIHQKLDKREQKNMPIIDEEEQTDREGESGDTQKFFNEIKYQCNKKIREFIEVNRQIEFVVNVYKMEMKELAVELVNQNSKIQQLQKESKEKGDNKVQRRKKSINCKNIEHQLKKEQDEQLKARRAPSPFPQNSCKNCATLGQRIQILQQEHTNWKTLSAKIDECKRKIISYEHQIKEKNEELNLTRNRLFQSEKRDKKQQDEEQKKRLKKDNTTLRGEKVLLNNQIAALKRQLAEKVGLAETQDTELKRLRMQVENLNNSLYWQVSNINQLRMSFNRKQDEQMRQSGQRNDNLSRYVFLLTRNLEEQELITERFNQQSKKLEQNWNKRTQKTDKRIAQLQTILQDKNETIIKLKAGSKVVEKGGTSGFQADMVKVLNKRLAEKEERIRFLEETLRNNNSDQ